MSDNRISVVHEVQPGDGLTVCCGRSLFELPMTDRATNDSRQRTCHSADKSHSADQSVPVSRVDLSSLGGGGDPSSGVVELPEDELEAVAQAAVAAVRAGGGSGEAAVAMVPELQLLAARVRAEAAETVAAMCHWVQDVGAVGARESHEAFHFGYSCPYEAAGAVLRGEPDPRRDTVSDSGFLARVRAEAVADERQRAVEEIRAAKGEQVRAFGSDPIPYLAGRVDGLEDAARIVAAGSVPVATPEPEPTTMGPCGHYWATGPHTYTNTAQWPNVIGHCPGPVATPTEPDEHERQHLDYGTWPCAFHGDERCLIMQEIAAAASPVPAEQPSAEPPAASWGDLAADVMGLVDQSLDGEPPVPAEQPVTCEHGSAEAHVFRFPGEYGTPAWCVGPATSSVAAVPPPTFEQLLTDPLEQFDTRSELLPAILRYLTDHPRDDVANALQRSIEEYRNAPPAAASTSHMVRRPGRPAPWFRETEESLAMLDEVRAEVAAVEAAAELRAARAELSVLRPTLRRAKQRIGRLLAYGGTFIETSRVRAALTGTETAGQAVSHLALVQASLPPGLTEVAGGTETHCRTELERWVAEHGLRDGERALTLALVAETIAEPGVGVYTTPAGPA